MTCSVGGPFVAGMYAQTQKLRSAADNIANVQTDGFKKTRVTIGQDVTGNPDSVVAHINTPGSPVADLQSLDTVRESSNVNLAEELVTMIVAQRAYRVNVEGLRAEDERMESLFSLLA